MSRRDKQTFDRLYDLFSEEANFEELRKHVDQLAFSPVKDCIPYLGIYLTDLTYIGKFPTKFLCETEIWHRLRYQPKVGIGIRAECFFTETETFFFKFYSLFPTS